MNGLFLKSLFWKENIENGEIERKLKIECDIFRLYWKNGWKFKVDRNLEPHKA